MGFAEYGSYDAVGLAELVRARKISARELVDEAIARIEQANPRVNAVVCKLYEQARATASAVSADAPFAGVPFLVKDLGAALKGAPFLNGSRLLEGLVPDHDADLCRRYKAAGLVVVGKTNTPELGIAPVCEPELFGPTHTPWKLGHTSGGSSGGSAAAVAAGMVPMAHGGDGGGSLRIPASCCGLFGFKPSRGRMPVGPDRSDVWGGAVVEHAVTRSVRDSAALLDVTHGATTTDSFHAPAPSRPYTAEAATPPGCLRVALSTRPHFPCEVHPDCVAAAKDTAALLQSLGHSVEEIDLQIDQVQVSRDFFALVCIEAAHAMALAERVMGRKATPSTVETSTFICGMLGRQRSGPDLAMIRERFSEVSRSVDRFMAGRYDVLLTPTLARPPLPIGALQVKGAEKLLHELIARLRLGVALRLPGVVDEAVKKTFGFIPFTPLANMTGQPAMSVPLYWNNDGLPIGSQFIARVGDEATLFRLAAQLEQARPWANKRPAGFTA